MYTLDNTNELIIWDVRYFTPLQILPAPNQKEKLSHGLIVINATFLWVYGSRFITYDEQEVFDEADKYDAPNKKESAVAINAYHNEFFSTICVQTAQDLKIYSCLDG